MTRRRIQNAILAAAITPPYYGLEWVLRARPEPLGYQSAPGVGRALRPVPLRRHGFLCMKAILGATTRSARDWLRLQDRHSHWLGRLVIELLYWMRLPAEELRRRVSVRGLEHLDEALAIGRGALLFANHVGNFTAVHVQSAQWASEVCAFGNALYSPVLERRYDGLLRRLGVERQVVGRGKSVRAGEVLGRNGLVVTFTDLSTVTRNNTWVRFGKAAVRVNLGPAVLALRHNAPALCITSEPTGEQSHRVTLHPPLTRPGSGEVRCAAQAMVQRAADCAAREVGRRPEQWWLWDQLMLRMPHS